MSKDWVVPPTAATPGRGAAPDDPRWQLVQRIAASPGFARSRRLQEFLLFVCERELQDGKAPSEAEVAKAVFGRPRFDPTQDSVVRVQATQLRRRLALYFSTDGAHEPVIIELGHGTYRPAFRTRPVHEAPAPSLPTGEGIHPRIRPLVAMAAIVALLAVACVALLLENRALRARRDPDGPRPILSALWRQMFDNGRRTYVVLGDSSLTTFQDLVGLELSPTEYEQQQFTLLRERLTDPVALGLAGQLAKQRYTSIADAKLAAGAVQLNTASGLTAEVILARDANPQLFRSNNVILAGPRRSNPWVELFEPQLNFRGRSRFDNDKRTFAFVNHSPRPGEPHEYAVKWGTTGYCRVAYLPNLDGNGSVLLVTGGDMSSGDAGASFVTSEARIVELRRALGIADGAALPYFEALLRTNVVASSISSFDLVAHRLPPL